MNTPIDKYRGTGRSTRLALKLIVRAMDYPGHWIDAVDHFGTHQASINLVRIVENLIVKMNFKGFCTQTSHGSARIQFNMPKT